MPTSGASASRRCLAMRWRLVMAVVMSCGMIYLASVENALDSFSATLAREVADMSPHQLSRLKKEMTSPRREEQREVEATLFVIACSDSR